MKKLIFLIIFLGVIFLIPEFSRQYDIVQKEKHAMLRDDFKSAILLKTPDQVIAAVGRPDTTQQAGTTEYWNYHHSTKDPVTGKVDNSAQVVIENGIVQIVNF
jgi:hypothetical protein